MPRPSSLSFDALLSAVLRDIRLELSPSQREQLRRHYDLLMLWNTKINLTSIRNPEEIVQRHFGESLFLARELLMERGTLVDIGSGAGFPGFPIAVACPNLRVSLLESSQKKGVFLKEVARFAFNAEVLISRIENVHRTFDWAAMRAVRLEKPLHSVCPKFNKIGLLIAHWQVEKARTQGILWQEPILLPWGQSRVLLIGRNVPRGTF